MKKLHMIGMGSVAFLLSACGGSSDNNSSEPVVETGPDVMEVSQLDTGSVANPVTVYFDLDNNEELLLSDSEAEQNEDWDIAFLRTKVYLNRFAENPVTVYYTGNADDFYDEEGGVVVEAFINATSQTELDAFEAFDGTVPEDAEFMGDSTEAAIEGFYNYDVTTHVVTANDAAYFIVSSDGAFSQFRVASLVQDQFGMSSITLSIGNQSAEETEFSAASELEVNTSECAEAVYIDLDAQTVVDAEGAWDIMIPCENNLGTFNIQIAEDATALTGAYGELAGIEAESIPYYPWLENVVEIRAIKESGPASSSYGWAEYGVNGGHIMWPNYALYIVQTATARYKFQILNYYDTETEASGSFTIRFQEIETEEQ